MPGKSGFELFGSYFEGESRSSRQPHYTKIYGNFCFWKHEEMADTQGSSHADKIFHDIFLSHLEIEQSASFDE